MKGQENRVPEFGERVPGAHYVLRPGSYGLAFDDETNRVGLMRTRLGYFLPGGGAEASETEEETLIREVREECGHAVTIIRRVGVAIENVRAGGEGHFAKRCTFFEVRLGERCAVPCEDGHALVWLPIDEARQFISHGSQRWALETAVRGR